MGGQGFIPEDGQGGLVEGDKEAKQLEKLPDAPRSGKKDVEQRSSAPRGGMQGTKERGSAPTPILPRPGTTPAGGRTDVHRTTEQSAATAGTGDQLDSGD
jgi:hypothetical protein